MTAAEYAEFRHQAIDRLRELNERAGEEWGLGGWERWDYDMSRGSLTFSQNGEPRVVAKMQVVGSTSTQSNTWLWGLANENIPPASTYRIVKVLDFGEREGIDELTTDRLPDEAELGWTLTAVTAQILGAVGAYRCPGSNGDLYLVLLSLHKPDDPALDELPRPVECSDHGEAIATFLCRHLVAEPAQAWFREPPDDAQPWPDAWCGECEKARQSGAELDSSRISMQCHHCYEELRAGAE